MSLQRKLYTELMQVADEMLSMAREAGFVLAGVGPAAASERAGEVRQWIADGQHGEMRYLEENLEVRLDPGLLLDGAASVLVVGDAYAASDGRVEGEKQMSETRRGSADSQSLIHGLGADGEKKYRGRVARYAWGDDYHKVLKKRLHQLADRLRERFPDAAFRVTIDTAPMLEREAAARAGLGWQAKNTMLIHPRHGSYFLLGTIVTTLELEGPRGLGAKGPSFEEFASDGRSHFTPQPLSPSAPSTDHCANCTRCIDACPTDAIAPQGYTLDARRCISYLTLEHRGLIPTDLFPGMGNWIAGCDICQEVCPYNKIAERHPLPIHPRYRPRKKMASGLELIDVLSWTADDRAEAFRGSALKRMKLNMVRRNALIAAGNVLLQNEDAELRAAVERCLDDDDDLVRQTAELIVDALPKTQGDSSRKPV